MITHDYRDKLLTRWATQRPDFADAAAEATTRVRYYRGEASEHVCACGEEATEWQLTDLREVEGHITLPYSVGVNDYAPECSACGLATWWTRHRALNGWTL